LAKASPSSYPIVGGERDARIARTFASIGDLTFLGEDGPVWWNHWKVSHDPFLDPQSPFVATPTHAEAVARLVHSIENAHRIAVLRALPGLGKTRVLARALAESRTPTRRLVRIGSPTDGAGMFARLAGSLGARLPLGASRDAAWRLLADAVRLCRCQRLHVVLAVDDCQFLSAPSDRLDLERLLHLDPHPAARFSVVMATRGDDRADPTPRGGLAIRLSPMSRAEAEAYVTTKLAAAGRLEPTFTPRALNRLHIWAEGNPRLLDRLASLALLAGAVRGLEIVAPEVIDGVANEILPETACA
jgi:type II secretory pathway predicted ATPase ExeA